MDCPWSAARIFSDVSEVVPMKIEERETTFADPWTRSVFQEASGSLMPNGHWGRRVDLERCSRAGTRQVNPLP